MIETNGFSASLDYTFQIAKGSASDPQQARNAIAGGSLPEIQLTPLDWDQRNTVNMSLSMIEQIGEYLVLVNLDQGFLIHHLVLKIFHRSF